MSYLHLFAHRIIYKEATSFHRCRPGDEVEGQLDVGGLVVVVPLLAVASPRKKIALVVSAHSDDLVAEVAVLSFGLECPVLLS